MTLLVKVLISADADEQCDVTLVPCKLHMCIFFLIKQETLLLRFVKDCMEKFNIFIRDMFVLPLLTLYLIFNVVCVLKKWHLRSPHIEG